MSGSDQPRLQPGAYPLLRFLGATRTVTGSRFVVSTARARVMIDCGLFQGLKELRLRNWDRLPIEPASIDAVVLTHAHLDHSGYLPALCRDGFRGPIYASEGTGNLCRILLPDSARLQEEEAGYANRTGYSRHSPALPLYTEDDAWRALERFQAAPAASPIEVAPDVRATFRAAGHILGSTHVALDIEEGAARTMLFSGDLGRPAHPLLRPPAPIPPVDVIVVESTYGDRRHDDEESLTRFEATLRRTIERRGVVLIPSFAVDRTEVVLFHLHRLIAAGTIPGIPLYVDSPMALAALELYRRALAEHSPEMKPVAQDGPDPFDSGHLREVRTIAESRSLNDLEGPMVIISASGMATGGRVLHHLARRLSDPRNTVMLVGYQAEGTRGRSLLDGARSVKMLGRYVQVQAEVVEVPAFSVHADQREILDWLAGAKRPPQAVYVVHGDGAAAESLRRAIESEFGWHAVVPQYLEQVRLD